MGSLVLRTFEFFFYHLLISVVDRVSPLPRGSTPPDMMRLYRENLALKAQNGALLHELDARPRKRPRVSLRVRAAQVFGYLVTRGNTEFQSYYLGAPVATLMKWATIFRHGPRRRRGSGRPTGRPPTDQSIATLVVTLKQENPIWGARRIRQELRRMGIKVSEPTVQRILGEHGFHPRSSPPGFWDDFKSSARDAMWALDFFAVRTAKGTLLNALLVIDIHTRELLDLRVHDGWDVDSTWTTTALATCMQREGRSPAKVLTDNGKHFRGQFEKQMAVMEIEQRWSPRRLPNANAFAERAIESVRMELLNHVRVRDAGELQWYLDEYRGYYQACRSHQGIAGQTPESFGRGKKPADVISLDVVRRGRLVKKSYAHGLLNSYSFAIPPRLRAAAPPRRRAAA